MSRLRRAPDRESIFRDRKKGFIGRLLASEKQPPARRGEPTNDTE
jgi:hypothetical protein